MLDLCRLESGMAEFDIGEHDIREILQHVIVESGGAAREKSIRTITHLGSRPIIVRGDSSRLAQLFSNVLENAVNFSPSAGAITITAATCDDGAALITIADSGPGIDESEREKIFEALHPMANKKTKGRGQGFGLGLAIARAIAGAHHGRIWFTNNPAGGSMFSVLLPGPEGGLIANRLDDFHFDISKPA
jgi:signal transduction histidine kinase